MAIVKNVIELNDLGADFQVVGGNKIVNVSIFGGVGAPTGAPPQLGKPYIYIDTATDQITHYWDGAAAAWVAIAPGSVLPPYGPTDAGKRLQVNAAGTGLEWVGPEALLPRLEPVLENTLTTPPTTNNIGDSYIVPVGANGAWAGKDGQIATWNGTGWIYYAPQPNNITTVQTGVNAGKTYRWDATATPPAWVEIFNAPLPSTANGVIFSSQKTIESAGGGAYIYNGDLFAWGADGFGINGATQDNSIHSFVPNKYDLAGALVPYAPTFVDVAYNTQNIYAIDQNGFVWAAGKNTNLQIGDPAIAAAVDTTAPTLIPFFKNNNIKIKTVVVPAGGAGTIPALAISTTGQLYTWGRNTNGQLGIGSVANAATPVAVAGMTSVKKALFSSELGSNCFALKTDGTLWATGLNAQGSLGIGSAVQQTSFVQTNTGVADFDTWNTATLLCKTDGTAWATGGNTYGILGRGNTTASNTWVQCLSAAATPVTNIATVVTNQGVGADSGWLITQGKKIWCAGRNAIYCLGIGNVTQQNFYVQPTITQAPFQGLVKSVVSGGNLNQTNFVLTTTGDVWSAGRNGAGERGVGNITTPAAGVLDTWRKVNYPNPIVAIRGMGQDISTYTASPIYALDVEGGIWTHGHQKLVATDGVTTVNFYSPQLAPTPYSLASASSGSGSTVSPPPTTTAADPVVIGTFAAPTASSTVAIDTVVVAAAGSTQTLPTAIGNKDKRITIKKAGSGVVNVATTGGETIDGVAVTQLTNQSESRTFVSDGANWVTVESHNEQSGLYQGNAITVVDRGASQTDVVFDNFKMRWNGATDRFEIAVITGTSPIEYITAINYGAQSAVINGAAGVDGSTQGTPMNVTTTYAIIGDPGILGIERRVFEIWATSGHYTIVATRKGTIATNGWCDFVVYKIGLATNTPISVAAPLTITGGQISYTAPYVRVMGSISLGDLATATVLTTYGGVTASVVSGAGTAVMIMQVNFTAAVPDAEYKISGAILANATEAAGANASVLWEIAQKTTTGFRVIFREAISIAQNCVFEFSLIR